MTGLGITVLGCAGTWSSADSACSGYLVADDDTRIWVDCGPGSFMALQAHVALADLDALVVTHVHPDHAMELPVIRNAMVHGLGLEGLPLYAPEGVMRLLDGLTPPGGVTPPFLPTTVRDGTRVGVGTLTVTFSRTDHPVETLAVRVDPIDRSAPAVAYSSDTGPGWEPAALGDGIGVLVHEATYLEAATGPSDGIHSTAASAGRAARAAGAGQLVITHVPPNADGEAHRIEAEAAFGLPVTLAAPHRTYRP